MEIITHLVLFAAAIAIVISVISFFIFKDTDKNPESLNPKSAFTGLSGVAIAIFIVIPLILIVGFTVYFRLNPHPSW